MFEGKASVLIVDDSKTDAMFISEAMRDTRIEKTTHIVDDGADVISFLQNCEELPSLIILDLQLPGKDGLEVLQEIKADPKFKRIPVLVATLNDSPEIINRAYEYGANAYMVKPISPGLLFTTMECIELFWFTIAKLPTA